MRRAWAGGFSTKSEFARYQADHVAIASSLSLITTTLSAEQHGRTWFITAKGLTILEKIEHEDLPAL